MRLLLKRLMKIATFVLTLLWVGPIWAESLWTHNGSLIELTSDNVSRKLTYSNPRAGLPVTMGTLLFDGVANGVSYSGTAYVFSSVCGAIPYYVSGGVNVIQRNIILYGQAPTVDRNCNTIGYRNDVLIFSYYGCGCECGEEPELLAIFGPPRYTENTNPDDAHSCPFLYAWNESDARWMSYGKVIRDARGNRREMTDAVKLAELATKFRLREEEPEQSFIDRVALLLQLRDGSQIVVKPTTKILAERDSKRLYIPAFGAVEFEFKLPHWLERSDVEESTILITGYYEELPMCPVPGVVARKQAGNAGQ